MNEIQAIIRQITASVTFLPLLQVSVSVSVPVSLSVSVSLCYSRPPRLAYGMVVLVIRY